MSQVAANPGYDLDLGMCTSFASFIFLCLTTLIILHSPTAGDIRMIGLFNISEEWFISSTNLDSLFSILHTLTCFQWAILFNLYNWLQDKFHIQFLTHQKSEFV